MNKIIKIVIVALAIFVGLGVVKNGFTQMVLSGALSKAAHVPVHIGSTHVQLLATTIDLKNIRINNPRSFPEKLMLSAPEVYISFDLPGLFKGLAHFREVKLNLKEIVVIKNASGELNINALKPSKNEKKTESGRPQGEAPKLMIDKLSLTIGRVIYKDYSQGGEPKTQVFDINIQDRQYTHIDNVQAVVSLVMFEALTRTSLSRLTSIDLDSFKGGAGDVLAQGLGLAGGVSGKAEETAKGILNLFK